MATVGSVDCLILDPNSSMMYHIGTSCTRGDGIGRRNWGKGGSEAGDELTVFHNYEHI